MVGLVSMVENKRSTRNGALSALARESREMSPPQRLLQGFAVKKSPR